MEMSSNMEEQEEHSNKFTREMVESIWNNGETNNQTGISYQVQNDYYGIIDPWFRRSPYGYLPVKSSEPPYNKIDQPHVNHIRNGVAAIVELNEALRELGSNATLSEEKLREVVALFSVHDLHKFTGKDWREQFNISEQQVMGFARAIHADLFASALTPQDFHSAAVGLHKKQGFHGNLSETFLLLQPWISVADSFASMEKPEPGNGIQKQIADLDRTKMLYYHLFMEAPGVISNILHTSMIIWAKQRGLVPLLLFEKGVLYLGKAGVDLSLTEISQIDEIYEIFKHKLQTSHPSLADPKQLQQSIQVQGSKGLYSIESSFFFYSGLDTVTRSFLAAAVLREESESKTKIEINVKNQTLLVGTSIPDMQYPPADIIQIPRTTITSITVDKQPYPVSDVCIFCKGDERKPKKYTLIPTHVTIGGEKITGLITIEGTGLMTSQVGYRSHILDDFGVDIGWNAQIISYARAISGIRKDIISPLIDAGCLSSINAIQETCQMLAVSPKLTDAMVTYAHTATNDHHAVGGFWNYSYAIARDLLDRDINGITFSNMLPAARMEYLFQLASSFFSNISEEKLQSFEKSLLYPINEKLKVWISENLNINDSMLYGVYTNKNSKFKAYCEGGGICRLTNDTPYDNERQGISKDVSMLKYSFSNRLPIGSTEPALYVSVPIQIELGLRTIGHRIKKGEDKLYFRLIPDYFFSYTTAEKFRRIISLFSGDAKTNIAGITHDILRDNVSDYESMIPLLAGENGRKGFFKNVGDGYQVASAVYDFVINKPREKDGEYWFFGCYLALILAAATGCRIVAGENPICMIPGSEFGEFVALESPHISVKRIFNDRIPLSSLPKTLEKASLLISLGYEVKMDDSFFSRYLQVMKNRQFPGSYLLKLILREFESGKKKGGIGSFVVYARGWRNEDGREVSIGYPGYVAQAIRLDLISGETMAVKSVHELARLGIQAAVPRGHEPHRVERLFREACKAILVKKQGSFSDEDYIDAVEGRILKMFRRAGDEQFYGTTEKTGRSKIHNFAEAFVIHIFVNLADRDPGKLKRAENDLADGFYAATLQMRDEYYAQLKSEKITVTQEN